MMPFVEFHYLPEGVVMFLYMTYLTYVPSQCNTGRTLRMLSFPYTPQGRACSGTTFRQSGD